MKDLITAAIQPKSSTFKVTATTDLGVQATVDLDLSKLDLSSLTNAIGALFDAEIARRTSADVQQALLINYDEKTAKLAAGRK